MEFKEFLDKQEEELFESNIDQLDEVIGAGLKFLGGVGGNLVSQSARGLGNIGAGAVKTFSGAGKTALAALQAAGGGIKKAGETFGSATSDLKSGSGGILRGATQLGAALSGISPILRGAQAASEPTRISGVYAPASSNRNFTQDLLGLDSWEKPNSQAPQVSQAPQAPQVSVAQDKSPEQKNIPSWEKLVRRYKIAKTQPVQVRNEIRAQMMRYHPARYQKAIETLQGRRKNKT